MRSFLILSHTSKSEWLKLSKVDFRDLLVLIGSLLSGEIMIKSKVSLVTIENGSQIGSCY